MKKTILTVAVFLMGISVVNATLINSYDFKGSDTAEQLSDKTGNRDLDNHYHGGVTANDLNASSGIVLTDTGGHSGYASFPGFGDAGTEDFIGCDAGNPNPYSVSFWIRFADNHQGNYRSFLSSGDWQMDFDGNGNIRLKSNSDLSDQNIVSDPTENIWHHIVVEKTPWDWSIRTQVYYDNEQVVANSEQPGGIHNYWFGANRGQGYGFAGDIANVKIYDNVLDSAAVNTLYSEGAIPEPMSAALFGFIGLMALLRKRIMG